jgi:hypothetical protein
MGAALTFGAAAAGAPPIVYQWSKDGSNLNGATATTYAIPSATRRDSGVYQVVAIGPGGSTFSSNALLTVRSPQKLTAPAWGSPITLTSRDADGSPLLPADLPNFRAQATTNLVDWVTLLNGLTLSNGSLLLADPESTNHPFRSYRIFEP